MMKDTMRSVIGWFCRLGDLGLAKVTPGRRPARVPSSFDSLERREVLSTASLFPWVTMPAPVAPMVAPSSGMTMANIGSASIATTATPAPYPYQAGVYPQANPATVVIAPVATTAAPTAVYYYGQPVVQAPPVAAAAVTGPVALPVGPVAPAAFVATDPATQYVESLYHDVLGRTGDPTEVASWLQRMGSGMTPGGVATGFVNSIEHRQDQVAYDYQLLLHRAPDAQAALYVDALLAGVSEGSVAEALLDSPEYQAMHQDSGQFVQGLYVDVLGRQGKPAEVAGWQAVMSAGETRSAVVASFVGSPEAVDLTVDRFYESYLQRRVDSIGLALWSGFLEAPHGTPSLMEAGILSSPEYVLGTDRL